MIRCRCFRVASFVIFCGATGVLAAQEAKPVGVSAGENQGPVFGLTVRVTDETGQPAATCEAMLLTADGIATTNRWKAGNGGEIVFGQGDLTPQAAAEPPQGKSQLLVRAPLHCCAISAVELPARVVDVKLSKGQRVELTLKPAGGVVLPDALEPVAFREGQYIAVWLKAAGWKRGDEVLASVPNIAPMESLGGGRYAFQIDPAGSDLYVLISHPGFLRGYQAGPFTAEALRGGKIEAVLPQPARVSVTFRPKESAAEQPYGECAIGLFAMVPMEGAGFVGFVTHEQKGTSAACVYDDLAPGKYMIDGFTGTKATRYERERPGFFRDSQHLELKSGEAKEIAFEFVPFDEAKFKQEMKGDYGASIVVKKQGDAPLAEKAYKITCYDRLHAREVTLLEGQTGADGRIELKGLGGGAGGPHFGVEVDGKDLGTIWLDGDQNEREIAFTLPPDAGDTAPDLRLQDIATGHSLKLSDFKGQVVFVDFWATWCGPCQEPMKHNSEITARRGADWAGKAVILGLSIDEKPGLVVNHCKARGWDNMRHLWCGEGENVGWNSEAVKVYGIRGVPTALLIDPSGKIVWRGHPSSCKVEEEIDKLLKSQ